MIKCTHEKTIERARRDFDWDMNDYVSRLVTVKVKTFESIDSTKVKCTQCNQVFDRQEVNTL